MIQMQQRLFVALDTPGGIAGALQTALELEHATIPPYLVAGYSLKATNAKARSLILDVAREEMLHMMLVANLMNAIGMSPSFRHPSFVPVYPTTLPGAVQQGVIVPLAPFSMDLLKNVFLEIEEPENPVVFPVVAAEELRTIGQFYGRIKELIQEAGNSIFTGDPARQIETVVDDDDSIVVTDVSSAIRAIDFIVGQGEGTPTTPFDEEGREPAHYYRFQQILKEKTLSPNPNVAEKFSFGPPEIKFTADGVFPVKRNLKVAELPIDSPARMLAEEFNHDYTQMLFHLHDAFNGAPDQMNAAVNLMEERLKLMAKQLVQIEISLGVHAGPTFEFVAP